MLQREIQLSLFSCLQTKLEQEEYFNYLKWQLSLKKSINMSALVAPRKQGIPVFTLRHSTLH